MPQPLKPFATLEEQIDTLLARGLELDRPMAEQWLRSVSYYRMSGYWYPFRVIDPEHPGTRLDAFCDGATLDEVVRIYAFDRRLRTLVHDGIERIEVSLRRQLSDIIGRIDPLAYQDAAVFRPTFDHEGWIATALRRAERAARHSHSVRHHQDRYDGALPVWVLSEVLDFSDLSRLYDGLLVADQWAVADAMGVRPDLSMVRSRQRRKALSHHPLARWLEQLTVVRNTCAHHARLWNRSFVPAPTAALRTCHGLEALPEGQSERIAGTVIVVGHLVAAASPGSGWAGTVQHLIDETFSELHLRSATEMGFPT